MYDFVTGRVVARAFTLSVLGRFFLFDYLSGQKQLYQNSLLNNDFIYYLKKTKLGHETDLWMQEQ